MVRHFTKYNGFSLSSPIIVENHENDIKTISHLKDLIPEDKGQN